MANIGEKDELLIAASLLVSNPKCVVELRGNYYYRNENDILLDQRNENDIFLDQNYYYRNENDILLDQKVIIKANVLQEMLLTAPNDLSLALQMTKKSSGNHIKTDLIFNKKKITGKSWQGANPTIFNASNHTKARCVISPTLTLQEVAHYNQFKSKSKIYDRIASLIKDGKNITFDIINSLELNTGLETINKNLPLSLGNVLLDWRLTHQSDIKDLCDLDSPIVELLYQSLLGFTSTGGISNEDIEYFAAVRPTGKLVIFDLTDKTVISKIKYDLYSFSYFDTPSTSRHDHGYLYLEKEVSYIDLGFQIRLKTLLFRTDQDYQDFLAGK